MRGRRSFLVEIKLGCALGAIIAGTPAVAQAVQASDAAATATGSDEIIVTAQKRAERFEDVPISISAVSGLQAEQAGITRFEDISRIAPGVQISRTGVYSQPAIRGVTTALGTLPENNVATYLDGIYIRSPRGLNNDLANITSIQVLKGPQGTLFGRNATGGAILIETIQPSLTETIGRFSATYARFDDRRVQGYVSTPLAENAALGVLGAYRRSDGYIKDVSGFDTAPLETYSFGAKLRLEPTDDISVTAKVDTSKVADGRGLAITMFARPLAGRLFPGSYIEMRKNRTSLNHPVINRSTQYTGSLKAEYRMEGATLTSITSYQAENTYAHFESDGSAQLVYDQYFDEDYRTFQQEFNLASTTDGPLQYVLGLYYYHGTVHQHDNFARSFPSTVFLPQTDLRRRSDAYAAFGDITWEVADRLFLTGGLRYSVEKPRVIAVNGAGLLLVDQKPTFKSATPRAVARYEIGADTNVYASYSKGFKAGFVDSIAPFLKIKPEKIDAYEIGFKTRQGKLRFDTAAYYYDYRDLQVGSVVIINGINNSVTANAATAEIYGAEAQLVFQPTNRLNVNAGVAYTHARYKSFPNAVVSLPNATTGLNSGSCVNPAPPPATRLCTQDYTGQRIVRSPDWSVNVGVDYTVQTGAGDILLAANGTYTSAFSPTRSDRGLNDSGYRYLQPEVFLLNLRAAWTLPGDNWTLSVFGRNVTNATTFQTLTGNAFGDYKVLGEPATYGLTVDYRF